MTDWILAFFNFIMTLVMSLVQIICYPINLLFEGLFPDFSNYIDMIDEGLEVAFNGLSWALSFIPPSVRSVLLFIFTIELSLLAVLKSTHLTAKAYKILQKIKFW